MFSTIYRYMCVFKLLKNSFLITQFKFWKLKLKLNWIKIQNDKLYICK